MSKTYCLFVLNFVKIFILVQKNKKTIYGPLKVGIRRCTVSTDGFYTKSLIEQQSYDSYQLLHLYTHTYIFVDHPNYTIGHLILMELFGNHVTFSLIPDAYIEPSFQH